MPIEVAANEEIRTQWKPEREIQLWFEPSFQKRVRTLLLLLKLQPRIGWVPSYIRNLLVQYVAKTTCVDSLEATPIKEEMKSVIAILSIVRLDG